MRELGSRYYTENGLKTKDYYFSSESHRLDESRVIKSQSAEKQYDIFLSHSSRDKEIILYLKKEINSIGFSVYVDWIDNSESGRMEITPKLKIAMNNSFTLLYIHTHNSENSKWTPWEIGYFDSKKGSPRIGIMPILNNSNSIASYSGQEYLTQYNQIGADYLKEFIAQSKK